MERTGPHATFHLPPPAFSYVLRPCLLQCSVCFLPADDIRAEQQIMCSRWLRWQCCVRHPLIKLMGKVDLKVLRLKGKHNALNNKSHIMFPWKNNFYFFKFWPSLLTVPCQFLLSCWPLPHWEPSASLFMQKLSVIKVFIGVCSGDIKTAHFKCTPTSHTLLKWHILKSSFRSWCVWFASNKNSKVLNHFVAIVSGFLLTLCLFFNHY